jgi:hypothetical protein
MEVIYTTGVASYSNHYHYYISVMINGHSLETGSNTNLASLIYELMNGAVVKDCANFLYELDGRKAEILYKLILLPLDIPQYLAFYIKKGKLNINTLSKYFYQSSNGKSANRTIKGTIDDICDITEYFGRPISKEERYKLYAKILNL